MKKFLLVPAILFFLACNNEPKWKTVGAIVKDQGPIAADGCGWHIITDDGIDYIPDKLDPPFLEDGLPVMVTFSSTDSGQCGFTNKQYTHPLMVIKKIERK